MAHVLVVDDEADIRQLVRVNLELDGHHVTEAADGIEALRELQGGQVHDLVVLDLTMPRLDGWEVLVTLKAAPDPVLATVPVILLTANSAEIDRIRGGIEGAVRYITKPFEPAALREQVEQALEAPEPDQRRRARTEAMERLAVLEKGGPAGERSRAPRPRVTRLGGPVAATAPVRAGDRRLSDEQLRSLSARQLELLRAVAECPTVLAAAHQLRVSRSNVYASLRRIARRLGVPSVPDLVVLARRGVGGGQPV